MMLSNRPGESLLPDSNVERGPGRWRHRAIIRRTGKVIDHHRLITVSLIGCLLGVLIPLMFQPVQQAHIIQRGARHGTVGAVKITQKMADR